jgi:hypothetical protein
VQLTTRRAAIAAVGPLIVALLVGSPITTKAMASSSSAGAPRPTELTAREGSAEAKFGTSVAIDGDIAVVGAPDEGGTPEGGGMGAAYVFSRREGAWNQQAMLAAPIRRDGDKFGYSVAVDGDTIVVGASSAEERSPGPGSVHVFVRHGSAWIHRTTLRPKDSRPGDSFGFAVDIFGDTVLVGAASDQGAAYVFGRTGGVWSEQAKLTAKDGAAGDAFGYAVALSEGKAVVSAVADDIGAAGIDQGSAYVFTRKGSVWTEQAKLIAADGGPKNDFGDSIAVFGEMVVIGAPLGDGPEPRQGSAYVFVRSRDAWMQQAKLTTPDGHAGDLFGRSVDVSNNTVVIGAHFKEDRISNVTRLLAQDLERDSGAAFVFARGPNGWSQLAKLTAADSALLGVSIGLSGNTVVTGANFTQVEKNNAQGAAYVYELANP